MVIFFERILTDDCIKSNKIYRSVHYIIKYKGVYLEIQVRTLFEESWGEIDHALVYPYYVDDPVMSQYTQLLNRISGLADEMGSFFKVVERLEASSKDRSRKKIHKEQTREKKLFNEVESDSKDTDILLQDVVTPQDCLNAKMSE